MYTLEIKNTMGACEKEYRRKFYAIQAAKKAIETGYIYFDNPELRKQDRKFIVTTATIFNQENGETVYRISK